MVVEILFTILTTITIEIIKRRDGCTRRVKYDGDSRNDKEAECKAINVGSWEKNKTSPIDRNERQEKEEEKKRNIKPGSRLMKCIYSM